jgi:hypothetical protein
MLNINLPDSLFRGILLVQDGMVEYIKFLSVFQNAYYILIYYSIIFPFFGGAEMAVSMSAACRMPFCRVVGATAWSESQVYGIRCMYVCM